MTIAHLIASIPCRGVETWFCIVYGRENWNSSASRSWIFDLKTVDWVCLDLEGKSELRSIARSISLRLALTQTANC